MPEHRYNDLLGQVQGKEMARRHRPRAPLPTRESKDAQVMAWLADRILAGEFADAAAAGALAAD